MAQDRKVFVGGVPQDLNQDDLYAIFSEYAGVKKAWLQKCRATDDGNGATNPPQNHRGFGFVIFHDPNAIEELLGGSASRFIVLRNGAKLEVKRALSSSKMSGVVNRSDAPQESPTLSWPAAAGRGQPPAQQSPLRPGALQPQQRQVPGALATQQARPWVSQDGNVLSQLSLMPNSAPTYPNADVRGKTAMNSAQVLAPPGGQQLVGIDRSGGGLIASDGTPLSTYGMMSQQVPPQPLLPHPGLLCPPGPVVSPMQSMAPRQHAFSISKGSLRDIVIQFYKEHRPDKLMERDFVDSICSYYKDKEDELDDALRHKYGVGLPAIFFQRAQQDQRALVQGGALAGATANLNTPHAGNTGVAAVGGSHPSATGYGTVAKGTTNEPMYAGQLSLENSWLVQAPQQRRPPMPQAAPPATGASAQGQHQWQMLNNTEHIAGNVTSTTTSGLRAPGLFIKEEAGKVPTSTPPAGTNAAIANNGPAPRGNGGTTAPGYPESLTGSYVGSLLSTNGRVTTDVDVQLVSDLQQGGAQGQGDEGFEISVEVAEAIVGKFTLDNAIW